MDTIIEVKDLRREYVTYKGAIRRSKEVVEAVRGIDFTVNRGEIFGLLVRMVLAKQPLSKC